MSRGLGDVYKRQVKKVTKIAPGQNAFEDQLEVCGFETNEYSAYKFTTTVEIPHMKEKEEYPCGSLKCYEEKEAIDFMDFHKLKS